MAILRFNPRSREGSDYFAACSTRSGDARFNPRSREGSDIDVDVDADVSDAFQSTLPRRERL